VGEEDGAEAQPTAIRRVSNGTMASCLGWLQITTGPQSSIQYVNIVLTEA
jgi:hypothetical protein